MSSPFDSFQQGMMTGHQIGADMRQGRNRRELGGLMASADVTGARNAAFQQGDLGTGLALDGRVQQQAAAERGQQLTGALAQGDYDQALTFAQSPEELQQITEFRNTASEAERASAAERAGQMASIGQAVRSLPPEQRLARAQQLAGQYGVDPSQITADTVTDEALEAFTVRALGLKDYLAGKRADAAAQRPIIGNGFISLPPGSALPGGGQPQALGSTLPPGWTPQPRPNQPSAASAAVGGERSQTPRVSFRSSGEARQSVSQLVPGVNVTNADRTPADTARIRRQGYNPSDTSFHLQGQALDLTPPAGMTMRQLEAKMRQAGFRVLNEGHHIHVSW